MANKEIERKFLLKNDTWRTGARGKRYRQGYLCTEAERTVRVRVVEQQGFLTIKGKSHGAVRAEFEYKIPRAEADALLKELCVGYVIEKIRYKIDYGGLTWEIDEFLGENAGLFLAEVELSSPGQPIDLPPWVGEEVTGDERYYNAYLSSRPYRLWKTKR